MGSELIEQPDWAKESEQDVFPRPDRPTSFSRYHFEPSPRLSLHACERFL